MNLVFILIVAIAFAVAAFTGSMEAVSTAIFDGSKNSVTLAISLMGYMALFLGLMKVAEEGGLLRLLARAIRPLMVRLFPDVPPEHPAMGAMIMNIAANMLGLTNAATPLGIKAMQELNKLNRTPGVATNAMALFLAINTSGLALLPSGAVSVRAAEGSTDPWGIMASTLVATATATVAGVLTAKVLQRLPWFAPPPPEELEEEEGDSEESDQVQELMAQSEVTPDTPGVWVLRLFLVASMAFLAGPPLAAAVMPNAALPQVEHASYVYEAALLPAEGHSWTLAAQPEAGGVPDTLEPAEDQLRLEPQVPGSYRLEPVCEDLPCPAPVELTVVANQPSELRHFASTVGNWVIPTLVLALLLFGWARGVKVYESFVAGAKEGWETGKMIIPYLVAILFAVGAFRASGAMGMLTGGLSVVTDPLGIPSEVLPMGLVRPLSGSGAYGLMIELVHNYGPDSYIGYFASTLQGSTDTTFYVLAVYFGAVGITRTRHALFAGLSADLAGFMATVVICRLMWGALL